MVGSSGIGKSSPLNALINESSLLPTSGVQASTSVAVEISYNKSDDPDRAYTAEIVFIDAAEWLNEFKIAAQSLRYQAEGEQVDDAEANIALGKLNAVYPGVLVPELLAMSESDIVSGSGLSEILGKKEIIHECRSSKFAGLIKPYIDSKASSHAGEIAMWPLVKLVKVMTKAPILRTVSFIDLPGLGDSCQARTAVTMRILGSCDQIWIVSDITRAVTDQTASELLNKSFQQQLLAGGKYNDHCVTMVCTRSDQINFEEISAEILQDDDVLKELLARERALNVKIRDIEDKKYQINERYKQASKSLTEVNKEIKGLDANAASEENAEPLSQISKRKLDDFTSQPVEVTVVPAREELIKQQKSFKAQKKAELNAGKNCDKPLYQHRAERGSVIHQRLAYVVKARNDWVEGHVKVDFQKGYQQLIRQLNEDNDDEDGVPMEDQTLGQ